METEVWRPVVGHPGYDISNQGRVQTSELFDAAGRKVAESYEVSASLGGGPKNCRYLEVSLRGIGRNAPRTRRKVHHLVAEAFIGPRPKGLVICHNDGDRFNNRAENLRYDTQAANVADMYKHRGGHHYGSRPTCAHGHALTPENTYASAPGRKCKTCQRARARARHRGTSFEDELRN